MTQDKIIEMAQECGLIGMRPHLDGIYSEALVVFAKLIAQRTWVGLTDEQMLECNMDGDFMVDREIAKLNVQAKLKEKNT